MVRAWMLGFALALAAGPAAAEPEPGLARFGVVWVAPVQTSFYLGRVALSAGAFRREAGGYSASYAAKVFPYYFWSETGTLRIELSDEALRRLAAGAAVPFTGKATRADGRERWVEGRVAATGPDGGAIKVRLHVGRRLVLVFDTSYRLAPAVSPSGAK
jgi:hypothetical protein